MPISEKVFIGIKAVRDSGKTNMFDRKSVQFWAFHMNFYETVNFLEDHKDKYIEILTNTDWDAVPTVYSKDLLPEDITINIYP